MTQINPAQTSMKNLRQKYPEYNDMDDTTLSSKIAAKYPEYQYMADHFNVPKQPALSNVTYPSSGAALSPSILDTARSNPDTKFDFADFGQKRARGQEAQRPMSLAGQQLLSQAQRVAGAGVPEGFDAEARRQEFNQLDPPISDAQYMGNIQAAQAARTDEFIYKTPHYLKPVASGFVKGTMSISGVAARLGGGAEDAAMVAAVSDSLTQARIKHYGDGSLARAIESGAASLTQLAVASALPGRLLLKGAMPSIMMFTTTAVNEALTEGEAAGLQGSDLYLYAAKQGATEALVTAIFSKIGLGGLENAVVKQATKTTLMGVLKDFGIQSVAELTEETTIHIINQIIRASSINGAAFDLSTDEGVARFLRELKDVALTTLLTMGVARGPTSLSQIGKNPKGGTNTLTTDAAIAQANNTVPQGQALPDNRSLPSPAMVTAQRATERFDAASAKAGTAGPSGNTIIVDSQGRAGTQEQHDALNKGGRRLGVPREQLFLPPPEPGVREVRIDGSKTPEARFIVGPKGEVVDAQEGRTDLAPPVYARSVEGQEGRQRVENLKLAGKLEAAEVEIVRLKEENRTDSMTGVGNKLRFEETLAAVKKLASKVVGKRKPRGPQPVILFDAANFKEINTVAGHPGGDKVLIEIASKMQQAAGKGAVVTRQGGDEFAVFFPKGASEAKARATMKRIEKEIGTSEIIPGLSTFAIGGIAMVDEQSDTSEALKKADEESDTRKLAKKIELGEATNRTQADALVEKYMQSVSEEGAPALPAFPSSVPSKNSEAIMEQKEAWFAMKEAEKTLATETMQNNLQRIGNVVAGYVRTPQRGTLSNLESTKLAKAYEAMAHHPDDPEVRLAYEAFKQQTLAQYNALLAEGYTFGLASTGTVTDTYPTADHLTEALATDKHLTINSDPGNMPADHPLYEMAPGTDWTYNQMFRAVHDVFGHAGTSEQFSIEGEENAWREHATLYTGVALGALATETRGQSTWVGFGPFGKRNTDLVKAGEIGSVKFPDQKAGLLPKDYWVVTGGATAVDATTTPRSVAGESLHNLAGQTPWVDTVLNWVAPEGTYRRPIEWVKRRRGARAKDTIAQEHGIQWSNRWGKAIEAEGIDITDRTVMLRMHSTLQGRAPMGQWSPEVQDLLVEWRNRMDDASKLYAQRLEEVGLHERAAEVANNVGTYTKSTPEWTLTAARRVTKSLKNFARALGPTKSFGKVKRTGWTVMKGEHVIGRSETEVGARALQKEKGGRILPPRTDAERDVEDVHDPRYVLMAGMGEAVHDTQMIELHQHVVKEYGQRAPEDAAPDVVAAWAEDNELVILPHAKKYHALKDLYIPKHIAEDLTEMVNVPTGIDALLQGYLRVWKKGTVVYNPATHGRNIMSNALFFSTLARTSPANPNNWKHYADGWGAIRERGALWEEMVEQDVLGGEYYNAEIKEMTAMIAGDPSLRNPGSLLAMAGRFDRKLGKIYMFEDAIFKAAAYMKYRDQGMNAEKAGEEVNKWFPNYDRTAKLTRWLSKKTIGMPFASFMDQSIRIGGRAAKERPMAVVGLLAAPGIMSYMAALAAGITDDEDKVLRSGQGILERHFTPYLPWRDSKGKALMVDLRYIVPLVNDLVPTVREHGAVYIPWFANGPIVTTFIEQMSGRSQFTGQEFKGAEDRLDSMSNLLPLPSVVRHAPNRFARSRDTENKVREDTAYAIVGSFVGLNLRRPYQSEQDVLEAAAAAKMDGDLGLSNAILRTWNKEYRPSYRRPLSRARVNTVMKKLQE